MSDVSEAAARLRKCGTMAEIQMDGDNPTGWMLVRGDEWDDITDVADEYLRLRSGRG